MKNIIKYKLNAINLYILQNTNDNYIETFLTCHQINLHIFNLLIYKNVDKLNFFQLSDIKNITPKLIEKYIDKNWNYSVLSVNKNLNENFIEKYINKNWNWKYLSVYNYNKFSLNFIIKHLKKFSGYYNNSIGKNINITEEFIEKYVIKNKDIHIDFYDLTNNKNISIEFITKYFFYEWNWSHPRIPRNLLTKIPINKIINNLNIVKHMILDNSYSQYINN